MTKRQFEDNFKVTDRLLPLQLRTKGAVTKDNNNFYYLSLILILS